MRVSQPRPGEPIRVVRNKNGPPRYRAVVTTGMHPDGRRRQTTRTFPTLSTAREWVAETRLSVQRGTFTAPTRTTVSEFCDRWLASRHDIRPVTRNAYRSVLLSVRARLGHRPVQDLRPSDLNEFIRWLATEGGRAGTGVSHRTVSLTLMVVKQMLRAAVAEGLIPTSPAETVRAPRRRPQDDREVTIWTPDELARFIAAADLDPWAACWRLAASGLRRSEVCGMRWQDLDLDAGSASVRQGRVAFGNKSESVDAPKSKASARVVPIEAMHGGTTVLLRSLKAQQAADRLRAGEAWQESGLVLVDVLGQPVRPELFSDRFREVCRGAGVPSIRLHDVRHSVATMLHAAGIAPAAAASLLGHGLQVHLNTYVTPTQAGLDLAGAALSRVLAEAQ